MAAYKGKIIEVHRQFNVLALAQNDPEVKAWYGQAFRGIGPYWHNKGPGSGLTFDEEKVLLPELVRVEATDKNFRAVVTNFYHEFLTKIPKEGIKLQVSLKDDNQECSEDNMPLNVKDYVTYRHIKDHPDVAPNQMEAERGYNKKYYIVDPEGASKEAMKVNELEDKATAVYMKYKDDIIRQDQILTMLGVNIRGMKTEDKILKLKDFTRKDAKSNEYEQKEVFSRFIKIAEDKDLEYRYLIQEMVGAQYLTKVGTAIHLTESGDTIASDMDGAVMYYKNPKNSKELNILRAAYLTKIKNDTSYLPKEVKAEPVKTEKEAKQTV